MFRNQLLLSLSLTLSILVSTGAALAQPDIYRGPGPATLHPSGRHGAGDAGTGTAGAGTGEAGTADSGSAESGTVGVETVQAETAVSGQGTAVSSGVVYPSKVGKSRPEKFVDELPVAEISAAEKRRIEESGLKVSPRERIRKYLKSLKSQNGPPSFQRAQLLYLDNAALAKAFPHTIFYVLRFAQWPVSCCPPEPLGSNNIFAINVAASETKSDTRAPIKAITEAGQLKNFLLASGVSAAGENEIKTLLAASLALSQELFQDGMYRFQPEPTSIHIEKQAGAITASGSLPVDPRGGNSGAIFATMKCENGKVIDFTASAKLMAGMRPICQSTKLLDKDELVRRMAEQDLLIMGSLAKDYLDWQRTQVSPALRAEIDRVWARILEEGR